MSHSDGRWRHQSLVYFDEPEISSENVAGGAFREKLDAAEASAAALTAALVECRVAAADEHLHRMRAEQTEAPTALLDCSFASRRRASGLMPG